MKSCAKSFGDGNGCVRTSHLPVRLPTPPSGAHQKMGDQNTDPCIGATATSRPLTVPNVPQSSIVPPRGLLEETLPSSIQGTASQPPVTAFNLACALAAKTTQQPTAP
ncbi:hypothetical protein BDK51DRAFT_39367 [Blyttiomyces helicus]|uniref:Uncharacterized protein n=1 Tax=Blyttiomyces helicus TaxID=388810 RepID=A0A4P9WNH4_9FUNG|nr:hypothetical protein BDK51DRAFT_39367 [Blyttiomyces helicus]|eukprot:RKO92316.1 hypothetical protein BDK51DRAFT_39367 [Blyttiomyces helicus]